MSGLTLAPPLSLLEAKVPSLAVANGQPSPFPKTDSGRTCLCGCNAQSVFMQMVPNRPFSDADSNFKAVLQHYAQTCKNAALTQALASEPVFQGRPVDLYLLFHIVLRNRTAAWRLHWRGVLQILGLQCSKEQGKQLKQLYSELFKDFDTWLRCDRPVPVKRERDPEPVQSPVKVSKGQDPLPQFTEEYGLKGASEPLFRVIRPTEAKTLSLVKKPRLADTDKFKELHSDFLPNPMTTEFRLKLPSSLGFDTDFRSGYLPIQIQSEQDQEPKVHFIRRKQSAINIKRCCGVTYVLPSESKQIGVRPPLDPLPPLAFQVGTLERCKLTEEEERDTLGIAKTIIKHIFDGSGVVAMTVLENCEEEQIKRYLLGGPRKEVFGLQDIGEMWRFLHSGTFVALHFLPDSDQLLFPALPSEVDKAEVIIGFGTKKGLCGTRSVKRCLEMEACEGDTLNTYANSIKLELYITKQLWLKSSVRVRKLLCAFITAFEGEIRKLLPGWNRITQQVYDTKATQSGSRVYSYVCSCVCERGAVPNLPGDKWDFAVVQLKKTRNVACCPVCRRYQVEPNFEVGKCADKILASKNPPNLYYLINTRDSFSYDLTVRETELDRNGRKFKKLEFFFQQGDLPGTFKDWQQFSEGELVRAGVTAYVGFFTEEELSRLEDHCEATEEAMKRGQFLEDTAQASYGAANSLKRTKFFFGSRYMWTACQLAERQSGIAAGVRTDVSPTPQWMTAGLVAPLVEAGVIEPDFINSIAMNIYHDGTEGLAQHFDDATRFHQPIYTVKLGSDARLSFGSQFYGFCNGAFCCPCPRGAVCVMEEFSYAANRAKHCVRPCDLTGRSITMILRQIHPRIMTDALRFDEEVDLPSWFSTLSLHPEAVGYKEQKRLEGKRNQLYGKVEREVRDLLDSVLDQLC